MSTHNLQFQQGQKPVNGGQLSASGRLIRWIQQPLQPISIRRFPKWLRAPIGPAYTRPRAIPAQTSPVVAVPNPPFVGVPEAGSPVSLPDASETRRAFHLPSFAQLIELTHRHRCPYCRRHQFRRSRPRSVEWVLCLARVVPYRCYCCNHRFFGLVLDSNPFAERESHWV